MALAWLARWPKDTFIESYFSRRCLFIEEARLWARYLEGKRVYIFGSKMS